jgi:hypothetical protein
LSAAYVIDGWDGDNRTPQVWFGQPYRDDKDAEHVGVTVATPVGLSRYETAFQMHKLRVGMATMTKPSAMAHRDGRALVGGGQTGMWLLLLDSVSSHRRKISAIRVETVSVLTD